MKEVVVILLVVMAHPAGASEPEIAVDLDRDIDLSNIVTSAAKGVSTVQEAPAIITIITADELQRRGFMYLEQALATIPGWFPTSGLGNQVTQPLVRGAQQALLLLRDGVSMFDPFANVVNVGRNIPIETIKRIEAVTGPGGVLWGANSFLGVASVVSKDADDVNGLEVSAGYGDGAGDKQHARVWAMFGRSFRGGRFKMMQHVSFDSFLGQVHDLPQLVGTSPPPQPTGPSTFGRNLAVDPSRSWLLHVDGRYSAGPVSLIFMIPVGALYPQVGFYNTPSARNRWDTYDRYVILELKDRYWKQRFGVSIKGYYAQFVRSFAFQLLPPSQAFPPFATGGGETNPGGLIVDVSPSLIHRAGTNVDFDVELPRRFRLLFGGELFWEGMQNAVVSFPSTPDPSLLPVYCPVSDQGGDRPDAERFALVPYCPRQLVNDTSRIVGALFADLQWKPIATLGLEAGVRLQKAFGQRPYDLVPLYSGAIVWNFAQGYHLKVNYATGFRAPVFQNVDAANGGLNFGSSPSLRTEASQSFQGELNARVLRGVRSVRELGLKVDYAYTVLDRLIQLQGNSYSNRGKRAIHSVEASAKLYLDGDHALFASYSFLHATTTESGVIRALPNHWLSLGAALALIKHRHARLSVNANLTLSASYQDPNRWSARTPTLGPCSGAAASPGACAEPTSEAKTSDITFDRLTPMAWLQLGFRLGLARDRVSWSTQFYNVLDQRSYGPDPFYDLTPTGEPTPTPAPGFNFFTSISYHP